MLKVQYFKPCYTQEQSYEEVLVLPQHFWRLYQPMQEFCSYAPVIAVLREHMGFGDMVNLSNLASNNLFSQYSSGRNFQLNKSPWQFGMSFICNERRKAYVKNLSLWNDILISRTWKFIAAKISRFTIFWQFDNQPKRLSP